MKDVRKKTVGAPKSFVPPRKLFVGPKVFFQSFSAWLPRSRAGPGSVRSGLRVCGRPVGPC